MQSMLVQKILEENDVLLKVNKPGTGQISKVKEELVDYGIAFENFILVTPYSNDFKKQAEKFVSYGDKLAIIDFDVPFNQETIADIKKTIDVAKEAGLQVIAVVHTPNNGVGIPNSETTYVSNKEDLFSALDQALESKFSLKDSVSGMVDALREKVGFGNKNDNKPKLK